MNTLHDPFGAGMNTLHDPFGVGMNTLHDPFGVGMNTLHDPFDVGMNTLHDPFGVGMNTLHDPFDAGMNTLHDPFGAGMNTSNDLFGGMYDAQIGGSFHDTAMDLSTQDTSVPFDQAMLDLTSQDFVSGQWTAPFTGAAVGGHDQLPTATSGDNPHGTWAWDELLQTLLIPNPPEPTASTSAVPASTTGEHQHLTHTDAPPPHITAGPPELFHLPAHPSPTSTTPTPTPDSHAQDDSHRLRTIPTSRTGASSATSSATREPTLPPAAHRHI